MPKESADNFSTQNTTKGKLPRLPFVSIKNDILGEYYELSVVFIGDKRSRTLNRIYREKDKPANVLSFPLSKTEGEIFLNLRRAEREAHMFDKTFKDFVGFLFIHGLLHLKGMDHGSRMEEQEEKFVKKFKLL
jgi:probable rRNA maturation factor